MFNISLFPDQLYCSRIKQQKQLIMKKVLAILALALFIGGISAPVIAANSNALTVIALNDEDPPKKKEATTEKTTEATKKSSDCSSEKKSSDCSTEKKSDCNK